MEDDTTINECCNDAEKNVFLTLCLVCNVFVRTALSVLRDVQSLWARERGTVVIGYLKR